MQNQKAGGFLIKYSQARRFNHVMSWAVRNQAKLVHLVRQNYLMREIACVARREGRVSHSTEYVEPRAVILDPDTIVKTLEANERQVVSMRRELEKRGVDCLEVSYEALVESPTSEFQLIKNFLGVDDDDPLACELQRLETDSCRDMIENWREVAHAIKGSRFEHLLGFETENVELTGPELDSTGAARSIGI